MTSVLLLFPESRISLRGRPISGYETALIADLPHLFKPGRNFHHGFTYYEWIRGQEVDFFAQAPRTKPDFASLYPAEYLDTVAASFGGRGGPAFQAFLNQYTANRKHWTKRASSIVETTATSAVNWLEDNHDQGPFYLQVEIFDPHEPVFLSDHGALLNEQGQWVKGPEKIRKQVTHVPLIVHLPHNQYAGKKVSGFVQTADIVPTVLGRLNLKPSPRVTAEDLWLFVTGQKTNQREYSVSAFGGIASVRTQEWNYSAVWDSARYKGNYKSQLYDLKNDPNELHNVADECPRVLTYLQEKLDDYLNSGKELTEGTFSQEL